MLGLRIVLSLPSLDARLYIVNASHMNPEQLLLVLFLEVGSEAPGQTGAGSRAPFQAWHFPQPPWIPTSEGS